MKECGTQLASAAEQCGVLLARGGSKGHQRFIKGSSVVIKGSSRCTQWQSVLVTFRSRSRGSRDVINGNQVHSVAISAPHLPFEIAWVNCGTDKREHETTPHMPHAPVMREAIRGHRRLSEAIRDNSPDAACTVHCAGVHWVVDLHSDHHLGGGAVHAAAHSADDDSSPRHHGRTAGSDGDEPR